MWRPALISAVLWCAPALAQTEQCKYPAATCGRQLSTECIARLGAGTIDAASILDHCAQEREQYVRCLTEIAETCGRKAPAASSAGVRCSDETARALWAELRASESVEDLDTFAGSCADSPQGHLAANRARRLREAAKASTATSEAPARAPDAPAPAAIVEPPHDDPAADEKLSTLRAMHREMQTELKRLGHYNGAIDGLWGPNSRAAMEAHQRAASLTPDGEASETALAALRKAPTPSDSGGDANPATKPETRPETKPDTKPAAPAAAAPTAASALPAPSGHPYDGHYSVQMECGSTTSRSGNGISRLYTVWIRNGRGEVGRVGSAGTWMSIEIDHSGNLDIAGGYNGGSITASTGMLFGTPLTASGKRGPRRCRIELLRG